MSKRYYNTWKEHAMAANLLRSSGQLIRASNELIDMQYRLAEVDSDSSSSSSDSSMSIDGVDYIATNRRMRLHQFIHEANEERKKAIAYTKKIFTQIEDETIDWNNPHTRIHELNEDECVHYFWFRKEDFIEVCNLLWPKINNVFQASKESIPVGNRYRCHYETGIMVILFRLSRPTRIRPEMEKFFRIRKSKLSRIISAFSNAIYEVANPLLNDPSIFSSRIPIYAAAVEHKSDGLIDVVWGFIDGTLRETCRPSYFQRLLYSRHKRSHGIKFQQVTAPDGLIVLMFGPINGSRHDSYMLSVSGLLVQLRDMMPLEDGTIYCLYGDPAYPINDYIFGGYRNAPEGSEQAEFNTRMSKLRICVEWSFGEITKYFKFLNFTESMKVFLYPVAQYYIIAAFFTNIHGIVYGNETGKYFNCDTMSVEEYINLK
jgi:hypothetical protein